LSSLQDDQANLLDDMRGMPFFIENVAKHGVQLHNYYTNTPICCPSRATTLRGRYFHNQRMPTPTQGGCMHTNIKVLDTDGLPGWNNYTVQRHFHEAGWTTGTEFPIHLDASGGVESDTTAAPLVSGRHVWQAPSHERRENVHAG
jgi:arylsulfatase A-like enzyme